MASFRSRLPRWRCWRRRFWRRSGRRVRGLVDRAQIPARCRDGLSEHGGEMYYWVSRVTFPRRSIPLRWATWRVSGCPAGGERICGGIVLEPVKVSVHAGIVPECDEVLMAEPRYELPSKRHVPRGERRQGWPSRRRSHLRRPSRLTLRARSKSISVRGDGDFKTPGRAGGLGLCRSHRATG